MPISSMNDFESIFSKKVAPKLIAFFLRKFGIDVLVTREVFNPKFEESNVTPTQDLINKTINIYGDYSGISPALPHPDDEGTGENVIFKARIIKGKVPNEVFDAAMSGEFERSTIYTKAELVPSDKITIVSDDGTKKFYIVGTPRNLGLTTSIMRSHYLDNMAGGV